MEESIGKTYSKLISYRFSWMELCQKHDELYNNCGIFSNISEIEKSIYQLQNKYILCILTFNNIVDNYLYYNNIGHYILSNNNNLLEQSKSNPKYFDLLNLYNKKIKNSIKLIINAAFNQSFKLDEDTLNLQDYNYCIVTLHLYKLYMLIFFNFSKLNNMQKNPNYYIVNILKNVRDNKIIIIQLIKLLETFVIDYSMIYVQYDYKTYWDSKIPKLKGICQKKNILITKKDKKVGIINKIINDLYQSEL